MKGGNWFPAFLISEFGGMRVEDCSPEFLADLLLLMYGLEFHPRAIVGSAKVSWVVDIQRDEYVREGFLSTLDSKLRWVNAIRAALDDCLESGSRRLVHSFCHLCYDMCEGSLEDPSEPSVPAYAVVASAVVLLSLVYHYLTGNVDRGGSKAYSRSSLDFRDIYVAIVLFQGAYVWIKFREAAFKGVHRRRLGGTREVYEARVTPPMWNGAEVPKLYLGRFATPQEAHDKFLIASFYYDRGAGLLDGWFPVPPMSEEERRLTGTEKRTWVLDQAKKVYEDFKKKKAEAEEKEEAALLLQELSDDQLTPEHDELSADFCRASLLNSAEQQQPALSSEVENSGMGLVMIGDNHGLEFASHSFDGMHESFALSNGHSLGSQEGSALPVSQLPPNTESGMSLNGNDQLDLLQTRLDTQQQQISLQQEQISDQQQQIYLQQQQIQEFAAQISQLQHQRHILQQQELQESRMQSPQWPCQFCLQQLQPQVINQGFPSLEVEMGEQSVHQHNYHLQHQHST